MRKVYSDIARVVETGIIIDKYGAERFVSDSFVKQQQGEGIGLVAMLQE